MRIGINTRSLLGQKMEGFGNYTLEIVKRLAAAHPEHTFLLYFDRVVDPQFSFGKNVICKSVFPPTRHPFLYIIWFQWRLKKAIQKDQLDVFWSPDGMFPLGIQTPCWPPSTTSILNTIRKTSLNGLLGTTKSIFRVLRKLQIKSLPFRRRQNKILSQVITYLQTKSASFTTGWIPNINRSPFKRKKMYSGNWVSKNLTSSL